MLQKLHISQDSLEKHGFKVNVEWIHGGSLHKLSVCTLLLLNHAFDNYFVKHLVWSRPIWIPF